MRYLNTFSKDIRRNPMLRRHIPGERTNFASYLQYAVFITKNKEIPRRIHETT